MMLPLLLMTATVSFAPDTAVDEAKKELERIQGTWVATVLEVDGKRSTPDFAGQVKLICTGDKYVQMNDLDEVEKGTHKLDPSKKPKHMDITITDGQAKGQLQLAIYELEGDTLKICAAAAGSKERPTEFSTKAGSRHIFVVLKREKKDKQ